MCTKGGDKTKTCWPAIKEKGMEDFINTGDEFQRFNALFKIKSTPKIFILDKDKKILLKDKKDDVSEDVKEDSELYDWILNYDELQDLKIRGTRDGIKGKSPAVDIMLSSDKQFVILYMDCTFYLLEKI